MTNPDNRDVPDAMTVSEAAEMCRVNKKTIYAAIQRGEFPSSKIGGVIRCYRPDVINWLRGSTSTPQPNRSTR